MSFSMKELRDSTGLTQKAFAKMYGIPLSTLRKWEQGESSPAPYVVRLIARALPCTDALLRKSKEMTERHIIMTKIRIVFLTGLETKFLFRKHWKA